MFIYMELSREAGLLCTAEDECEVVEDSSIKETLDLANLSEIFVWEQFSGHR